MTVGAFFRATLTLADFVSHNGGMKATITQLAAYVGVSERTIHRRLASNKWPHTRLPGGLVEIDDSLIIAPENGQEGLLLATLQRIEAKIDALSARVDSLSASKPPRVHVHTEQAAYTVSAAPGPGEQEGLQNWREFAKARGYSESTIQRWIDEGKVPVERGSWRGKRGKYHIAIDDEGRKAIDALYGG